MRRVALYGVLVLILFEPSRSGAEFTFFTPPGSFAVEVSLENSPYPRLPMYRNSIASLEVVGDLAVGGTAAQPGLSPFLFTVSLSGRCMKALLDLGTVVPGQREISSGFGRGADGTLYAGTIPDENGASGHLLQIQVAATGIEVHDLGVAVENEGVFALTSDTSAKVLYGIAYPSGKFFVRDLAGGGTQVYSETAITKRTLMFAHDYAVGPREILSRRLVVDRGGRVWGSMPVSKIFRFDPRTRRIEVMQNGLPEVWGRLPLGRADAWAVAPDGALYAGNAGDGQLFRLDPATGKVTNLGKPVMMPRITGLSFAADGKLYGVGGAPPGYAHLFSYDTAVGFVDLGNPRFTMTEPGIEQGIWWRGYRIGTVAASEDGRYIVLGEDEALSQLMVFQVQK
jgi:hypothetical protein